jgi:hypothetical protein
MANELDEAFNAIRTDANPKRLSEFLRSIDAVLGQITMDCEARDKMVAIRKEVAERLEQLNHGQE